jgi:hypothetical protein
MISAVQLISLQSSIFHALDVSKTGSAAARKDAKVPDSVVWINAVTHTFCRTIFLTHLISQDLVSSALKLRSAIVAVAAPTATATTEAARLGSSGSSMLGIVKLLEVRYDFSTTMAGVVIVVIIINTSTYSALALLLVKRAPPTTPPPRHHHQPPLPGRLLCRSRHSTSTLT